MKEKSPNQTLQATAISDARNAVSFEGFTAFIRDWSKFRRDLPIVRLSRIERDLGIVGIDGFDLLEAIEKRFRFRFCSGNRSAHQVFNLAPGEFLFSPEGAFDIVGLAKRLMGRPRKIKQLTVGELYEIVLAEIASKSAITQQMLVPR